MAIAGRAPGGRPLRRRRLPPTAVMGPNPEPTPILGGQLGDLPPTVGYESRGSIPSSLRKSQSARSF